MKKIMNNSENNKSFVDFQIKNMIIRDLTHAYDHLSEKDRLMRFSLARAITELHIKYNNKDI